MSATYVKTWTHVQTHEPHEFKVTLSLGWCEVVRRLEADGVPAGVRHYPSLFPLLKARRLGRGLETDGYKRT